MSTVGDTGPATTQDGWDQLYLNYPKCKLIIDSFRDYEYKEKKFSEFLPETKDLINRTLSVANVVIAKMTIENAKEVRELYSRLKEANKRAHEAINRRHDQLEEETQADNTIAQKLDGITENLAVTKEIVGTTQKKIDSSCQQVKVIQQQVAVATKEVEVIGDNQVLIEAGITQIKEKVLLCDKKIVDLQETKTSNKQDLELTAKLMVLAKRLLLFVNPIVDPVVDSVVVKGFLDHIKSVSDTVVGVAGAIILAPLALVVLSKDGERNAWKNYGAEQRYKILCQSIGYNGDNYIIPAGWYNVGLNTLEEITVVALEIMQRKEISGTNSRVEIIPYPIHKFNGLLQKAFSGFSCTFLNFKDYQSLEIIDSTTLGYQYSMDDIPRCLKPNRIVRCPSAFESERGLCSVWFLCVRNVEQIYLLVRVPKSVSLFSTKPDKRQLEQTKGPSGLIMKIYRDPLLYGGPGSDEIPINAMTSDIAVSYRALSNDSTIFMCNVARFDKHQQLLPSICELIICDQIEVVAFFLDHSHSKKYSSWKNKGFDNLDNIEPDYFCWENIDSDQRYSCLCRLLEVNHASSFCDAFNRRFPAFSCIYLTKKSLGISPDLIYQLDQNIQLKLSDDWKIFADHIASKDYQYDASPLLLTITVTHIEKIFLIVNTADCCDQDVIDVCVNREINRNDEVRGNNDNSYPINYRVVEELRKKLEISQRIDKDKIKIYDIANLIAWKEESHVIDLYFPQNVQVMGFIFQ